MLPCACTVVCACFGLLFAHVSVRMRHQVCVLLYAYVVIHACGDFVRSCELMHVLFI